MDPSTGDVYFECKEEEYPLDVYTLHITQYIIYYTIHTPM